MSGDRRLLNVRSEIGKLKKVLLHRPGKEIENLTPSLMDRLLFDDIPYLEVAREEHDAFADIFRKNGTEVVYLEDLAAEALIDDEIRNKFIDEFIEETKVMSDKKKELIKEYLLSFSSKKEMIEKMMAGIRKEEVGSNIKSSLTDIVESNYPFITDPMPNLYFTRDPFATIGSGVSLNHMKTVTRNRETLFSKYIFKYHKDFKDAIIPFWYDRKENASIEGGDQLILSNKVIAIGISERTESAAIEKIARRILGSDEGFEVILAFDIPKKRAFMHLDTVFTMVDYDKFTIHPEIEEPLTVYSLRKGEKPEELIIEKETMALREVLMKYLELDDVRLIRCGNGNSIDAAREQWNDGSNTLAIAPGEVIVYSRNYVTNRLLEEHGIKLNIMPSSEVSRGRGGPRCMSMPLYREDL
ncbi:arginine deiminase [Maledivibacter halophilus]|uniref:Arginine deiminase n=1 Tax=Maledivibacter halophilus TaxID=36842 RepID=A0A1T5K4G2_9FIRM|nr:arginine deiminase [Maledivibacter halophilus]SKC58576.1 arginine deiminase [Maledivibacter halophilus]